MLIAALALSNSRAGLNVAVVDFTTTLDERVLFPVLFGDKIKYGRF
jgi:hypothetical protein